jgi:hypothetical protein
MCKLVAKLIIFRFGALDFVMNKPTGLGEECGFSR